MGENCIRVGAKKTTKNLLQRIETDLWNYPTFKYVIQPDPRFLSPYGNVYWLYACVWVKEPFQVNVWKYGNGRRTIVTVPATVELTEGQDIWEVCKEIEQRWT